MRGRALSVEWLLARPWLVVAFVAIAIALPVVALGELSANDTRERLRAARLTEAESIAQRSADVLSFRIRRIGEQFATLASTGRMHLAIGQRDSKQAELLLAEARALIGTEVTVLWAVDLSGAVVAVNGNFPPSTRGLRPDTSGFPVFAAAIRSGRPRHFETAPETAGEGTAFSDATFYIAVPTTAADGSASSLNGILVGLLPGTIVENSLGPFRDATEIIYTVDHKGQVIHRTGSFTAGSPLRGAPLGGDLSALVPVAAALGGKAFVGEAEAPVSRARRIMSTAPVRELDTQVLVVMPPDPAAAELEATLAEQRSQRYGLVSLLLVGSALFAATASRTVRQRRMLAVANATLEQKRRDLAEALEQQTAVSEVLKVISSSPFELQPVLDTVIHNAVRLCNADWGIIHRADGDTLHLVTSSGQARAAFVDFVTQHPSQISPATVSGRAALERRTVHVPDVLADPEFPYYRTAESQRLGGFRGVLAVPLLRAGTLIGVIAVDRNEVRPFSAREIVLLETFADQAVIAIENVRLFNETKEALEQQSAISDVLAAIASATSDARPVFDVILRRAVELCDAEDAVLRERDGEFGVVVARYATHDFRGEDALGNRAPIARVTPGSRLVAMDLDIVHVPDIDKDPEFSTRNFPNKTALGIAVRIDGQIWGWMALSRREAHPFTDREIDLVRTFAAQAALTIANVRLFNETKEALEQQTATSEVLQVISRSAFDLQPVLDTVVEKAARLCEADVAWMVRMEGERLRNVAFFGDMPEQVWGGIEVGKSWVPTRSSIMGRLVLDRGLVQVPDITVDADLRSSGIAQRTKSRTVLGVPMLREGLPIGGMVLARYEVRPFTDRQVELVTTFADQAAIAIENVRLFNEIEQKGRQLEAANRHKSEFLANMSHELRTPLNAIIGFSEVMLQAMFGKLNAKQSEYAQDILSSGRHLLTLINDVLDLSKIEAGRMELELSEFSLPAALSNGVTMVRERATDHGIQLELDVAQDVDVVVADERKVKQVVYNLLSNAVKFTPDGGHVAVRAERSDGEVRVAVQDTGIGIHEDERDSIFEEFRQSRRVPDKAREGTGLGLTLSKKFVELHGGRIWVESAVGKGSTFTFTLPLRGR